MGDVIQFRPRPRPVLDMQTLEQQAIDLIGSIMAGEPVMIGMEPVIYIDTAPSEYLAPEDDPA